MRGAARGGDPAAAGADLEHIRALGGKLAEAGDDYWAEQVKIQETAASAWIVLAEGRRDEALRLMRAAADLEDRTEKHVAMENRLSPMREMLGEMFLAVGQPGASPWLGGLDIDDFGGDPVAAVASFGASAISPVQGTPQDGTVDDPDFDFFVTPGMVSDAHDAGIAVIPWTVDDPVTMRALLAIGVDGIITDRADLLREVLIARDEWAPL